MKDELDKILVSKPEQIKSIDDLEIILNDILYTYGSGGISKGDALNLIVEVIIQMMKAANGKIKFD